jgi:hypothetical protein
MKAKSNRSKPNDELLIHYYLMGCGTIDTRGLPAIGYIEDDGLSRLLVRLLRSDRPIRQIRSDLADLFDPDATQTERRLIFSFRRPGRRRHSDLYGFTIARFILEHVKLGTKREAAFALAQSKFNLNRSTVLKAWSEFKHLAKAAVLIETAG